MHMLDARPSLKEQQLKLREDAILDAVNRLLAQKGYEAMTVDSIAAEVGIAKASLYKHFTSKEAATASALTRLLDATIEHVRSLPADLDAYGKLQAILRWSLETRLGGGQFMLPAASTTSMGMSLAAHSKYGERCRILDAALLALIDAAKADGRIAQDLPSDVVLYTLYSRGCDCSFEPLRAAGHDAARIVDYAVRTCFRGFVAN